MRFLSVRKHQAETLITLLLALLLIPIPADALAQDTTWTSIEAFYDYVDSTADELTDFAIDEDASELWFTSAGGLVRWTYGEEDARDLLTRADGLPATHSFGIHLAEDAVWVATAQGLAKVDRTTLQVLDTWLDGNVTTVVAAEGDHLWIGTYGAGAFRLDPATGETEEITTGPGGNRLVRDVLVEDEAVWLATDGHGLLRYDRASAEVTRFTRADGLPSDNVTTLARTSGHMWVGTYEGLAYSTASPREWTTISKENGLPDNRVLDILFRGSALWVSTHKGVVYTHAEPHCLTKWCSVTTYSGLRSNSVLRLEDVGGDEIWFLTGAGVSRWDLHNADMVHFTNLNGIQHARVAASNVHDDVLWFSTPAGVSSYDPATDLWTNHPFPRDMNARGRTTYAVDVAADGSVWVGTQDGFWAFYPDEQKWEKYIDPVGGSKTSSDVFISLVIDGDDVWLSEFDTGVFRLTRSEGQDPSWDRYLYGLDGIRHPRVRDAEPMEDGVWLTANDTLHLLDVREGYVTSAYDSRDLPGERPHKLVPDGKDLWVLTDDAGIYRFSTEAREATDHYSTENGLPSDAMLAAATGGRYLWVSFQDGGLARVDLADGTVDVVPRERLLSDIVLNLVVHEGIVYAGTPYGIQRFDESAFEPLPVLDTTGGALAGAGANGTADEAPRPPRVYVTSPLNGDAAEAEIAVMGRATAANGTVDRVEVRLDDGPWQTADGTSEWRITLDLSAAQAGSHVIHVRAVQGDLVSATAFRRVDVLPPPTIPLTVEHDPVQDATAGRPLDIRATVQGDPPLTAYVWYRPEGATTLQRATLQPAGDGTFTATLPASDVTVGPLEYYLEAVSGRRTATHPEAPGATHRVIVTAPLKPALTLTAEPAHLATVAGGTGSFTVRLESGADAAHGYTLRVEGRLAHWASLDEAAVDVPAGGTASRTVDVAAPVDAIAMNDTLSVIAIPDDPAYEPVRLDVPLQVLEATANPAGDEGARAESPAPALALALVAIVLAAGARRGWRR